MDTNWPWTQRPVRRRSMESWIRQVHQIVCGPQKTYAVITPAGLQDQPLPLGTYKTVPNHVRLLDDSFHAYSPVQGTPDEMHRFVEELRSDAFKDADPATRLPTRTTRSLRFTLLLTVTEE